MKINVRGGHNFQAPGASELIDETTEDRKVYPSVIKYLKQDGDEASDVTPGNCDAYTDFHEGVRVANGNNADLFVSIHFNNNTKHFEGAMGSEVWLNPSNANACVIGNKILANMQALGFKNRGLKDGMNIEHLYEVRATHMPGLIVEVCFVEATEDVKVYQNVGYDAVGKAIAEGIVGHAIGLPLQIAHDGWCQISGTWYYFENKIKVINRWIKNGKGLWYLLDGNGAMVINQWTRSNNKWYWLRENGVMATSRWIKWNGQQFWVDADGIMAANTITPDGYNVDTHGAWDNQIKK